MRKNSPDFAKAGFSANTGSSQLIQSPRSPVSPSGSRLMRVPSAALTFSKTSPALAIGTLPTRYTLRDIYCSGVLTAALGVDFQKRAHGLFRAGARHAAFGGDAEQRRVTARRGDAGFGALGAVLGVHDAEEERGTFGELEIAKRPVKGVVAAVHRHGHMNVSELVRNGF